MEENQYRQVTHLVELTTLFNDYKDDVQEFIKF